MYFVPNRLRWIGAGLVAFALVGAGRAVAEDGPKISAAMHLATTSVQPGGQAELAVSVTIPPKWHTYHPIVLDTGAPPLITFDLPAGVSVGELRYPEPQYDAEKISDDDQIAYLALDGTFHVLTTLTVAPAVKPGRLPIRAVVDALVCQEECIPLQAAATFELNVSADEPQPADAKLFEAAHAARPQPLEKAEYLAGSSAKFSQPALAIGQEAELIVTINVQKGHHVQDRNPGNENLIASRLFVEKINGLKLGEQHWPEAKVRTDKYLGPLRELAGKFELRVPVSINDTKLPSGPAALRVLFSYQTCTDEGTCYPPVTAETVVKFEVQTDNPPIKRGLVGSYFVPRMEAIGGAASGSSTGSTSAAGSLSLGWVLVLALFGGLLLNIMPCVFPVISLKILGFVKQAGEDRGRILRLGLAFAGGVLLWFWIFAYVTTIGQVPLQYPLVVLTLITVLFVFGLNLFGVFEIILPGSAADTLGQAAAREGYGGAFLNGFLATLLGTACTAPAFGTAAAFAATQPRPVAFAIFTVAGLGMALPYLLLSAFPAWLKHLPKPGPWMVTFKQAMGFVLLGTACWLLYVLGSQLDYKGVVATTIFLCFLGFALWLIGRIGFNWNLPARATAWVAALLVTLSGTIYSFGYFYDLRTALTDPAALAASQPAEQVDIDALLSTVAASDWSTIPWQHYTPGLAAELSRRGYTVYLDYTATWCATCLVNKASSLEIDSARQKMKAMGVIPLEADYSRRNPALLKELLPFGRNSVPLNLIYPANRPDAPVVLPAILTPGIVAGGLDEAGPSNPE